MQQQFHGRASSGNVAASGCIPTIPRLRSSHYTLGWTGLCLGTLPAARQHLEEGNARYTADERHAPAFRMGQDPGVACRAFAAMALWLLGLSLRWLDTQINK